MVKENERPEWQIPQKSTLQETDVKPKNCILELILLDRELTMEEFLY